MAADVEDLVARLEGLAEELAERALDCLREAAETGDAGLAGVERRLTRARRAVEKAIATLRPAGAGD